MYSLLRVGMRGCPCKSVAAGLQRPLRNVQRPSCLDPLGHRDELRRRHFGDRQVPQYRTSSSLGIPWARLSASFDRTCCTCASLGSGKSSNSLAFCACASRSMAVFMTTIKPVTCQFRGRGEKLSHSQAAADRRASSRDRGGAGNLNTAISGNSATPTRA